MTLSIAILHSPAALDRDGCLQEMLASIPEGPIVKVVRDAKPGGMAWAEFKTHLALAQWRWALGTGATHHVFLTDDLHLAPRWTEILQAMIAAKPASVIGLLSNHPRGPMLAAEGERWYRCNSWVVGPAYVVPHAALEEFVYWYSALPDTEDPGGRRWFNDDSALNEWVTQWGPHESWHPLPTIVEHRADLPSTVGHGDRYSRERVSWRATREVADHEDGFSWITSPASFPLEEMCLPSYWARVGLMLLVGGE